MKKLKLFLSFVMLTTSIYSPAYAGFSSNGGFGGGSGGGGFSGWGSSGSSFGGGFGSGSSPFGSNPFSNPFNPSNPLNTLLSSDSDSSSSDTSTYISTPTVTRSPWLDSEMNPEVNPVVGLLTGRSAQDLNRQPTQSFMALLSSRSPLALFLDLDGDGVRGGFIDGMLFNLFFSSYFEENSYVSASDSNGRQSDFKRQVSRDRIEEQVRKGLKDTRLVLLSDLDNGQKSASLNELMPMIFGTERYKTVSEGDRQTALASVLMISMLNPAIAAKDGPVVSTIPRKYRKAVIDLNKKLLAIDDSEDYQYNFGSNDLAFNVSMSRLATIMGLAEHALSSGAALNTEAIDALRGALYFSSFELKRMDISGEKRDTLLKELLGHLMEHTPNALQVAAENAADIDELERLRENILEFAPVISVDKGLSPLKRLGSSTLAAGVAIGLWLIGGDNLVDLIFSNINTELAANVIGGGTVTGGTMILTNWLLRPPNRLSLVGNDAGAIYVEACERVLKNQSGQK